MTPDYLTPITWLISAITPTFPGIAPHYYALELLRLVGFWVGTIVGVVLVAAPVWNR